MEQTVKFEGRAPSGARTALKSYAEEHGTEINGTKMATYHDPTGALGTVVDKRSEMYEDGNWEAKFEKFDEEVRKGMDLKDAAQKAVSTADYAIPIHVSDDVLDVDESKFPVAETVARVAIDSNKVEIDVRTERGDADFFSEGGTVPENDDSRSRYTYNVQTYGRKNEVTDHIQLSRSSLNPYDRTVSAQGIAVRELEENQIVNGTTSNAAGFEGLEDWVTASHTFDASTDSTADIDIKKVRKLIKSVDESNGAPEDQLVIVDTTRHYDLRNQVDDYTRFESPSDEISFGFKVLDVDGVPVMKSSAVQDGDAFAFDLSAHYMAMLRDVTMEPQARGVGASDVADVVHTHAFGTFISHAKERVAKYENLN
jgi:HK97 family phage major capsid protein